MIKINRTNFFKNNLGKGVIYYLLFNVIFFLSHLALVSIFSFFHFLLDHDLNTIENWLIRNSWEVIILAKVTSFSFLAIFIDMQNYDLNKISSYLKEVLRVPSRAGVVFTLFISVFFYILVSQFSGDIEKDQVQKNLIFSSFFGSFFFFIIDFVFIDVLKKNYNISQKDYKYFFIPFIILFFSVTKILLPYINEYIVLQLLHFTVLFTFGMSKRFSDSLIYGAFVIAPISSFYGLDIVWENAFSVLKSSNNLPHVGIILFWITGLVYYYKTQIKTERLKQQQVNFSS